MKFGLSTMCSLQSCPLFCYEGKTLRVFKLYKHKIYFVSFDQYLVVLTLGQDT